MADLLAPFLRGDLPVLLQTAAGELRADAPRPSALLCGSFNPLHDGHVALADVAAAKLGCPVAFEIGEVNADKPAIPGEELLRRLAQFISRRDVWLTHEPTFLGKSLLFPGATFVVGYDTAVRLVDPRYYGDTARVVAVLESFEERGCRFLVAGRVGDDGRFRTADDVPIATRFRNLFHALAENDFRVDISSTAIRASQPP